MWVALLKIFSGIFFMGAFLSQIEPILETAASEYVGISNGL